MRIWWWWLNSTNGNVNAKTTINRNIERTNAVHLKQGLMMMVKLNMNKTDEIGFVFRMIFEKPTHTKKLNAKMTMRLWSRLTSLTSTLQTPKRRDAVVMKRKPKLDRQQSHISLQRRNVNQLLQRRNVNQPLQRIRVNWQYKRWIFPTFTFWYFH